MKRKIVLGVLMLGVLSIILAGCNLFPTQHTLTIEVQPEEAGTVTPESGSNFDDGAIVELEVEAAEGFDFIQWAGEHGDEVEKDNDVWKIVMDGDKDLIAEFQELSSDAHLSNLVVLNCSDEEVGLNPEFDEEVLEYETDEISQHGAIKFVLTPRDENALLEVNGEEVPAEEISQEFEIPDLENEFEIVVTAEDGTQLTYDVLVHKSFLGGPCN